VITYVTDASVAIKWYVPEVHGHYAARLLSRLDAGSAVCHVPDLFHSEVGNILWKKVRRGELNEAEAQGIVTALSVVPKTVHSAAPLLPSALSLALETERTVYDSLYLTLAAALDCELVTADERLWNALKNTSWSVFVRWIEAI
jgi:predicted nucleic acid-binding protein